MSVYSKISQCRICKNTNLIPIINLGEQVIASRFPNQNELDPPTIPLESLKCVGGCGLVQLAHNTNTDELYLHQYGYRSGLNNTMRIHLAKLVEEIEQRIGHFEPNDIILDIGSNDCTLLKLYKNQTLRRIGIDPTGIQFKQYYPADVILVPDFFTQKSFVNVFSHEKAKVVTSISMYYDLPNPLEFMEHVYSILADDGIWVMEQSYIGTMLERNSLDTICHEHLEYYAFKQIKWMADKVGFYILNVTKNDCNGGSFRITLGKTKIVTSSIQDFELYETKLRLDELETYINFNTKCELLKQKTVEFLKQQKTDGKKIYLYGASTKGNTLLQYYGITNELITAAAERNIEKYGRRTPKTNIPIVSEDTMRADNPDYLLVLPWHFKEEFLSREDEYLNKGGQYIFPLPELEIIKKKKCALITGITGQIGSYLIDLLLSKDYIIYGQTRNKKINLHTNVFYIECSVDKICDYIPIIMPDEIYHLAAETNALTSIEEPQKTLFLNGNVVQLICQTIVNMKHKPKLFVANSSEIYKGIGGNVDENTLIHYPKTPYAIGKLTAYWIVKYYRETYGLHCSTGILFNTESVNRKSTYVTQKIIQNLKSKEQLSLGNINISRDWIHAYDAANAMYLIMQQSLSSEYIISSAVPRTIRNFVECVSDQLKIQLYWTWDEQFGVDENDNIIVKIDKSLFRDYETNLPTLTGNNTKLKNIGWKIKYKFEDIVEDMCHTK